MGFSTKAYRLLFQHKAPDKPRSLKHKSKLIQDLLVATVRQEAINLIAEKGEMWSVDFRGATTRIYADEQSITLELNPDHFDKLTQDEQIFIITRELDKMRLGMVKPNEIVELTEHQQLQLDELALEVVDSNVARICLNKQVYYAAKDIHEANPRKGILNRLMFGYNGLTCPEWVLKDELDYNLYMGAITEIMADAAPEQLERFYFNERLRVLNWITGYRPTPLSPTIHEGFNIGNLSHMDVKA